MRICATWCLRALVIFTLLCLAGIPSRTLGQEKQHVVSLDELKQDAARPAEIRQADEAAVRNLLSSVSGQKALKSANLDLPKVDKAVSQLSDEDLAKLAERSRQAQKDFAAGTLSDRDLLWIILIIVAILIVALAVR
ncbi:MAG TPA: hypothetical protein VNH65_02665 [Candidatus Acidoferrum sp.]|nr:hypothetical protein [Candidatus Acidoferrum sp.]